MNANILLDYEGDLPAPTDVRVIDSEVDFLRYATLGQPLLIRGAQLCAWAESFYALRGKPVQVVESPRSALRRSFPNLSPEQVRELVEKIGREHLSAEKISSVFVLIACYPQNYALWHGSPSLQHAALWLLWLLEHTPSEAETVILEQFASEMQARSGNAPVAELYCAQNASQAQTLLWRWLGVKKSPAHAWGEFPVELPARLLNDVKEAWMKRIIETNGEYFKEMLSFPLPLALRQELARQTATYYSKNAHQLTRTILQQLHPYLHTSVLDEYLPPPIPSTLPENESDVLDWFEHQYLPYRRWQARFGDETARQTVIEHAQTFARWLLERYPRWLLDGQHLGFQRTAHLGSSSNSLTLCVIFDGLPAWDAEWLVKELSARAPRLTLLQKDYCFTALPTVTEFAKEALLRGVPPRYTSETSKLGRVLSDNQSPKRHLAKARAGQVWFWRVQQPDKAYHFEKEDKLERQILAEIQSILQEIKEVIETIPDHIPFNILLTSDHGRLMNSRSPRKIPIEAEMQAHGRAAWGSFQRDFPETGFEIDEQNSWVELYGERFGMLYNLRLAWDEASFATVSGTEAYPHGGLFPEEVIIPWFLFQRDAQPTELEITLTGAGEAEMSGEVLVSILNQGPLALKCQQINLSHGVILNVDWNIPPLRQLQFKVSLTPWPPKSAEGKITASLLFSQVNGTTFTKNVQADLQIKVLYDQKDDLFKEFDL